MITHTILLSIICICTLLTIRSKKWWLMAICAAVTGIWVSVGVVKINLLVIELLQFTHCYGSYILCSAFILFMAISAALWQNKNERTKSDKERIDKLRKAANEIKVAGFVEDSSLPNVTGWESYIKTLAERLVKSRLKEESFALGITGE